jgi:hypothetical protein
MIFTHTPHPHKPRNVNELHKLEQDAANINDKIAVTLTKHVGTMSLLCLCLTPFSISKKSFYPIWVFLEISKCRIATATQKCSNLSGLMVMIYGKSYRLLCTWVTIGFCISATSTYAILINQHLLILQRSNPISLTPTLYSSILCCSVLFICMIAWFAHTLQTIFCPTILCKPTIKTHFLAFAATLMTIWHMRFNGWFSSFHALFAHTTQFISPKSLMMEEFRGSRKNVQTRSTLLLRGSRGYTIIHNEANSLLSRSGVSHHRQGKTLFPRYYSINLPVKQVQEVLCLI